MTTERSQNEERLDYTPSTAYVGGTPQSLGGNIIAYSDRDIAANVSVGGGWNFLGIRRAPCAAATTFSYGDDVYWDVSASKAIGPGLDLVGGTDIYLGKAVEAVDNAGLWVQYLPARPSDRYGIIQPLVYEFDCDGDNGDTDEHILLPSYMNPHGVIYYDCFALITEVMAGSSEDQGIVTIEDEDDNALGTITATDVAADVVGDIIRSTNVAVNASDGAAAKTVAAGKAIQGFVSQQTSGGTPAGKMKVYLKVIPLV